MTPGIFVGVFTARPIEHARVTAYYRPPNSGCGPMLDWSSDLMTPATPFTGTHDVQVPLESVAVILTSNDQLVADYNITNDGQPPSMRLYMLPLYHHADHLPGRSGRQRSPTASVRLTCRCATAGTVSGPIG